MPSKADSPVKFYKNITKPGLHDRVPFFEKISIKQIKAKEIIKRLFLHSARILREHQMVRHEITHPPAFLTLFAARENKTPRKLKSLGLLMRYSTYPSQSLMARH